MALPKVRLRQVGFNWPLWDEVAGDPLGRTVCATRPDTASNDRFYGGVSFDIDSGFRD